MLIKILIGSLITETVVELIRKSEPLNFFRKFLQKNTFFESLLNCGYCTSFWVGMFIACFLKIEFINSDFPNFFISGLLYHRISNWLHNIYDIMFQEKMIKQFSVDK